MNQVKLVRKCGQVHTASGLTGVCSSESVPQEVDLSPLSSLGESWALEAAGIEKVEGCH